MKARRKWILGTIVLALALAGAMAVPFFVDEPPPDDADLRVAPVEVPHEENGFHVLDVKKEDIRWPGELGDRDGRELLRDLAAGRNWDPAMAREVLENNADESSQKAGETTSKSARLGAPGSPGCRAPMASDRPWCSGPFPRWMWKACPTPSPAPTSTARSPPR